MTQALRGVMQVVSVWQRRKARALGIADSRCGAVTFVQRFGGFVNLNIHFHILMPDGAFVGEGSASPRFERIDAPTDEEIASLAAKIVRRIAKILTRHREEQVDDITADAAGPRAGRIGAGQTFVCRLIARGSSDTKEPARPKRSAFIAGFSLHANVAIHQNDRQGLERLCRYGLRPPIAIKRLSWTDEGKIRYEYKRPAPNGAYASWNASRSNFWPSSPP